jgi:hypothetical protein
MGDTRPTCATCDRNPASYTAQRKGSGIGGGRARLESWPVCSSCREQGERNRCEITYAPLA